ncbi:MAG: cation acetate symporter [Planctomycetota bacterium]|nr:MAG: cation acetate symporter [Planctomycetota bacterium]
MSVIVWTYILVGLSFSLYIGIAIWARASSTKEFYIAGKGVHPLANGLATAADWMSAASFLGMAGLISFKGYNSSVYLMGWTGGYVLLALLLAPYLRKFGKFTTPDFIGDRYYSQFGRLVAVVCAIFISFTYVAGQMRGVGIVFSRFLEVPITQGVIIGMVIVLFYAVLGGMKGITYTQVAQYCVLIFAFTLPAIFISIQMTGSFFPQIGLGSQVVNGNGEYLLDKLDGLVEELGFLSYTELSGSKLNFFFITLALMCGTAGLPHVIVRFFTVPKVKDARTSAFYALFFIAILYTTAPAIAAFARVNLIETINNKEYKTTPEWFKGYENSDLVAWVDKNKDGVIQMKTKKGLKNNAAFTGKPDFIPLEFKDGKEIKDKSRGANNERLLNNKPTDNANEIYIDKDIIVLASPAMAKLPNWVIALVAAGGLAAALSTAAGLLLVISTSISHDLIKKCINPDISEKKELLFARLAATAAVVVAGYFGIHPPGYVAEVVAYAFGLAASSFFPAIVLGIFYKRMNKEGAISGMICGLLFTGTFIVLGKEITLNVTGVSTQAIGSFGMILNFVISLIVCHLTPPPPQEIQDLVEDIRVPKGSGDAVEH